MPPLYSASVGASVNDALISYISLRISLTWSAKASAPIGAPSYSNKVSLCKVETASTGLRMTSLPLGAKKISTGKARLCAQPAIAFWAVPADLPWAREIMTEWPSS